MNLYYYCHTCRANFAVSQQQLDSNGFSCVRCGDGFIEILDEAPSHLTSSTSPHQQEAHSDLGNTSPSHNTYERLASESSEYRRAGGQSASQPDISDLASLLFSAGDSGGFLSDPRGPFMAGGFNPFLSNVLLPPLMSARRQQRERERSATSSSNVESTSPTNNNNNNNRTSSESGRRAGGGGGSSTSFGFRIVNRNGNISVEMINAPSSQREESGDEEANNGNNPESTASNDNSSDAGVGGGSARNSNPQLNNFQDLISEFLGTMLGGGAEMGGAAAAGGLPGLFPFFGNLGGLGLGGAGGGSFGDYVFSQADLDRIISQLMEQSSGHGPAPAPEDAISKLPKVKITEENYECPVCKDEMPANTDALELPCHHKFHDECVKQWLKIHGTCPVCRHPVASSATDDNSKGTTTTNDHADDDHDDDHMEIQPEPAD